MNDRVLYASIEFLIMMQTFIMLISFKTILTKTSGATAVPEIFGSIVISLIITSLYRYSVDDFYIVIIQTMFISVFIIYSYSRDIQKVLLYIFVYTVVITFLDFASLIVSGIMSGDKTVLHLTVTEYGYIQLLFMLIVRIVLVGFYLFLRRKTEFSEKQLNKVFGYAGVSGLFCVIILGQQKLVDVPADTVFMWLILFIVIIAIFLLANMRNQYELEKEIVRMRDMEKELLLREYSSLNSVYSINARLFHDINNHINVIRQFLLKGSPEKALAYLNDLSEPVNAISSTVWTCDETIDYLINSKLAIAESEHIRTDINVEFPKRTNIRANDLCAILGNLMDNSLEACRNIPEGKDRFIELTIRRINNMLFIKIRNSANHEPKYESGQLKSTKTDGGIHGWGMKSIKAAADRYDGVVKTEYNDNVFQTIVSLSFNCVGIE